jgi:ABC-type phosphate transport system permease subunit
MTAPNHNWRNFKNVFMQTLTFACAILVVTPLLLVFYHLIKEGFSSINLAFFTQLPKPVGEVGGGMGNAIVGTFVLLAQAAVIGVPVGVLGGVFLSEYGGSKLNWWIRFAADILNGVPSITWGIVVYALMVVPLTTPFQGTVKSFGVDQHILTVLNPAGITQTFEVDAKTRLNLDEKNQFDTLKQGADIIVYSHRGNDDPPVADSISPKGLWNSIIAKIIGLHNSVSGFSALAGGVVLGLMMIPLVMRTTEEVLQLVPGGYREAALALGISKWKTIVQIVLRTAMKGIVTGVLLALARVAGETAPLLFTALGNEHWAHKLTEPIAAMPLQIFAYAISPYDDWHRQAWAGALVLLLIVLAINVGVRFLTRDRFKPKA